MPKVSHGDSPYQGAALRPGSFLATLCLRPWPTLGSSGPLSRYAVWGRGGRAPTGRRRASGGAARPVTGLGRVARSPVPKPAFPAAHRVRGPPTGTGRYPGPTEASSLSDVPGGPPPRSPWFRAGELPRGKRLPLSGSTFPRPMKRGTCSSSSKAMRTGAFTVQGFPGIAHREILRVRGVDQPPRQGIATPTPSSPDSLAEPSPRSPAKPPSPVAARA